MRASLLLLTTAFLMFYVSNLRVLMTRPRWETFYDTLDSVVGVGQENVEAADRTRGGCDRARVCRGCCQHNNSRG